MLAVVTCYFNFAGYSRPAANLRRFVRQMESLGVPVYGAELYLAGQKPVMAHDRNWSSVLVSERAIMWQKEKLINHVVSRLPDHFDVVAWIDSDVMLSPSGWVGECEAIAKSGEIMLAQLFQYASWTGRDGSIVLRKQSGASWFLKHGLVNGGVCHYGFAWAASRELVRGGLYDRCVMGGGDIVNFRGFAIDCHDDAIAGAEGAIGTQMTSVFSDWFGKVPSLAISSLDGEAFHEWHGDLRNRQFGSRHKFNHLLTPESLIDCGSHYEWSDFAAPELVERASSLFVGRMEDGPNHKQERARVVSQPAPLTVILTSHAPYFDKLDAVADSIARNNPASKIMVGDSIALNQRPGWKVQSGDFLNPNKARNCGLAEASTEWVVFWDGDNLMPEGYLNAMSCAAGAAWSRDAIVYPDVDLASGFGFDFSVKKVAMPEYSYWKLRDKTFIDTSSAWRREALLSVGGFSARQVKYDDYELALRLTRNNWSAKRAGVSTRITQHGERRSITNNKNDALWTAYTFAFVTLFGPNADKKILLNWYARSQHSLPPRSRIIWGCSFRSGDYDRLMAFASDNISIPIEIVDAGAQWRGDSFNEVGRHAHVASIYNSILGGVHDDFVMTIEDDNLGPETGPRDLFRMFSVNGRVRAMHAPYRSRANPEMACLSVWADQWKSIPYLDVPESEFRVGMTGGGFTMYANSSLRRALPLRCNASPLLGWDAHIGSSITQSGDVVMANGSIKVDHLAVSVAEYLMSL